MSEVPRRLAALVRGGMDSVKLVLAEGARAQVSTAAVCAATLRNVFFECFTTFAMGMDKVRLIHMCRWPDLHGVQQGMNLRATATLELFRSTAAGVGEADGGEGRVAYGQEGPDAAQQLRPHAQRPGETSVPACFLHLSRKFVQKLPSGKLSERQRGMNNLQ